jgi:hypothetical protein
MMKAPNSGSKTTERPTYCKWGEYSELLADSCTECPKDKMCGSNVAPDHAAAGADVCVDHELNSHAGEYSCFPYQYTWPVNVKTETTFTTKWSTAVDSEKIAIEIPAGFYNWNGGSKDGPNTKDTVKGWDCPPGYQCLFPFMQWWSKCPAGTYSSHHARTDRQTWACEPCEDQKTCVHREDTAIDALDGYWSPEFVHIPLAVRAGMAAGQGKTLEFCKAGYYSNN